MGHDLRMALRVLAKSPMVTALSVLSIALGIGLTAGMFSVGDAMLLRPMPFREAAKLLTVVSRGDDGREMMYGWPDCLDISAAGREIGEFAAYQRRGLLLAAGDETEVLIAHPVTPNYFALFGVRAHVGRASVDSTGGRPQAVLGFRLWQRRFGGDAGIVGRTVVLNRRAFVVSGVMPEAFTGPVRGVATDVWVGDDAWFTVLGNPREQQEREGQFEMVARLEPGVSPARAAAVLDAAIRGPGKHRPAPAGVAGTILRADFAPSWTDSLTYGGGLLIALALILFVACANVAQLRLAQAEWRRKELGVRMALGAGAWRIARQLVVETAAISLAGAFLGLLLLRVLMRKTGEFLAAGHSYVDYGLRIDSRVLGWSLAAVALSVLFSGLAPARHAVRLRISEILKSEQGATGPGGGWQKNLLVAGQAAVSVALFGLAVLFLTSLRNAAAVHPGLDPSKKLYVMEVIPGRKLDRAVWCEQACGRLAAAPGVRGATFARRLPLSDSGGGMTARMEIPGLAPMGVLLNNVGGNYFSLVGTRVVAGRGIDGNDRASSAPVAVVSRTFARQLFPGRGPIGEWVRIDGKMRQIVGVAEDGPSNDLHEPPAPFLFLPYAQAPSDDVTLMVETAGDPAALARAIRAALKSYDPQAIVVSAVTLRQHMDSALASDRMLASVSGGLGLLGVLLTAAGLFGVLQYAVNRRTRELGLRMALGARPSEIQRLVVRDAFRMAAWGIPAGLALLGAAARYLRSWMLGVGPLDFPAYLASAAAVVLLTLVAAWLPARRATRVDPMAALRSE